MSTITRLPRRRRRRSATPTKAEVVILPVVTRLDIPADRVIEGASGKLQDVVVVGWGKDGTFYFASSVADGADVVWLLETAKLKLLRPAD